MITKAKIIRKASDEGVPAKTVERDYALAHIIAAIAVVNTDGMLVFKGGTALRLCHFEDYRYSADLDFSVLDASTADGLARIGEALKGVGDALFEPRLTDASPPRISYTGPLEGYRELKLDLADDELVVNTEERPLIRRWDNLPPESTMRVYTTLEVAAEKLRCVIQRLQCRDLYDLHVLLSERGLDLGEAALLFEEKARHRGIDPAGFSARYERRVVEYEKRWERELTEHVQGEPPHFDAVQRAVARHLRRAKLI